MATPHISAEVGDIAKQVLMPGDPLRAEFIAKNWLTDVKAVSRVRNMLIFTGRFNGEEISIMGTGMGMPSIGIYSWELCQVYGVETMVRVGSCGAYNDKRSLMDLVLADYAWTNSNFAECQGGIAQQIAKPSEHLNSVIEKAAKALSLSLPRVRVHTSDVFYQEPDQAAFWISNKSEVDVVDMESFALFYIAQRFGRQAAALLTVTDSLLTEEGLSAAQREQALVPMIDLALNALTQPPVAT